MQIRKLKLGDATLMLEWMHDGTVVKYMGKDFSAMTIEVCQNFIEKSWKDEKNVHFAIVDDNDTYMGTVSLKNINKETSSAEFAITVRKSAMGLGYSKFGMKEIITFGFEKLGLKNIYWCVSKNNIRAVRFYDKNEYIRVEESVIEELEDVKNEYSEKQLDSFIWYLIKVIA